MVRSAGEEPVVRLRLTCLQPPESCMAGPTEFGLQDRDGHMHHGQTQPDGSILYDASISVDRRGDDVARLRGRYVHGPATNPFLYLSVKRLEPHPGEGPWVRRLKIPLPTVPWDDVISTVQPLVLAVRVSGSGSGTVPLLDGGWTRQDASRS